MRLIDADSFIKYLGLTEENAREEETDIEKLECLVTLGDVENQPTVDAEPVRYAKRIITKSIEKDRYGCYPRYRIKCSECGYEAAFSKYCPNCGAKMGECKNG